MTTMYMMKTCGAYHTLRWRPLIDWFMSGQPSKILPQTFRLCNMASKLPMVLPYDQLKHKMVVLFMLTSHLIGIVYKSPTTFYNLWYLDLHRPRIRSSNPSLSSRPFLSTTTMTLVEVIVMNWTLVTCCDKGSLYCHHIAPCTKLMCGCLANPFALKPQLVTHPSGRHFQQLL